MTDYAETLLPKASEQLNRPTAKKFFDLQSANERINIAKGLGSAPDFGDIFVRTLLHFAQDLRKKSVIPKGNLQGVPHGERSARVLGIRQELQKRAQNFLADMREIEMEDTIYPDVKSSMGELLRYVDGVAILSSGHPNYQFAKIANSKIERLMLDSADESNRRVIRQSIISRDKEGEMIKELQKFTSEHPEDLTVVVYDDLSGNFERVNRTIGEFERQSGKKVKKVFVWAKVGRVSEGLTDEKEKEIIAKLSPHIQENQISVASFTGFVNVIKELRQRSSGNILAFLDFDGAMSDNRLMRLRQYETLIRHGKQAAMELGLVGDELQAEGLRDLLDQILSERHEVKT